MTDTKRPKTHRRGRVYLRGQTWWLDFSRNGRRYRQPIEAAKNEGEAWDALDKIRAEAREGRRPDMERTRFEHLAERLLHHYEAQGARPRSLARFRQALAHLAFFKGTLARDIQDNVDAYVVFRR